MIAELKNIKCLFNHISELTSRALKETTRNDIYYFHLQNQHLNKNTSLIDKFTYKLLQLNHHTNHKNEKSIINFIIEDIIYILSVSCKEVNEEMSNDKQLRFIFKDYDNPKSELDLCLQDLIDEISYQNRKYLPHKLETYNDFKNFLVKSNDIFSLIKDPMRCLMKRSLFLILVSQKYQKKIHKLLSECEGI